MGKEIVHPSFTYPDVWTTNYLKIGTNFYSNENKTKNGEKIIESVPLKD